MGRKAEILLAAVLLAGVLTGLGEKHPTGPRSVGEPQPWKFWPSGFRQALERNPELEDFLMDYPEKKNLRPEIDLSGLEDCREVPLLLQWDPRWGYTEYAGNLMGFSGCGPTCLAMVCLYLFRDSRYTPRYLADFSAAEGYSCDGCGSYWALIHEGGEKLGLEVTEIPTEEKRVIRNLEAGNPMICILGPGEFTASGHFIVISGYEQGRLRIRDPNSVSRSRRLWSFGELAPQIRCLWVCRNTEKK